MIAETRLPGKIALVTGGASGIGRATALAFARQGARVMVADIDAAGEATAQAIREQGGDARFLRTDVARAAAVEALVDATVTAWGSLDCAFNNAGINPERGPLDQSTEEEWDRVIGVNLKGIWLCMKYEIPHLRRSGGAIVNTASVVGLSGRRDAPAYVASKFGIIGLTRAAALDYGPEGIRINAVCPGTIRTGMYDARVGTDPEVAAGIAAGTPLRRLGLPEDIAEAVVWLCSDAASFITGQTLVIDGGDLA